MEQIINENFKISPKGDTAIILHGKALDPKPPQPVQINGNIDSVFKYLRIRKSEIKQKDCHVIVNRNDMRIMLVVNERDHYQDRITGGLELHPDFKKWQINTGESWAPKQLSEFIKMNRASFSDKETAMKLAKELQDIKVKSDKEIEKSDNNRGDYKVMIAQKVIKSNIPEKFNLVVPIFKGVDKKAFEVEIYISPDTFSCSLVSPDVNDIVHAYRDSIIDEQLKLIEAETSDIVIIEQ
jgi:hypothetical protein